ncbi:MAG: hypothetical protein KDC03_05910, partial [Flavobacteriales bacterium]|nr:hypothetical protein [Flavobacteriales bacterium]
MKKGLLVLAMGLGGALTTSAQVIVNVLEPPAVAGGYVFTWSGPADGWTSPDLTDPANAVTDTLAFVDDGTAADSLGCNPLVNGAAVAGKIAVVYRGTCNFSTKVLNAENAGAVACVIINNVPGAPVGMGAGADGMLVSIPVVMISQDDGALLRSEILSGNVVMYIGSNIGFFPNDLGFSSTDIVMSSYTAKPSWVAQDNSEFDVMPGAWIRNNGSNDQTNVALTVEVTQGGSSLYSETSTPADIQSGDSAFFAVPLFSQPTYSGLYRMTYAIGSDAGGDDYPLDNGFESRILIDSLLSYADIDTLTELPIPSAHFRPSTSTTGFQACIHFLDPNASRLQAMGLYASTSKTGGASVNGEFIEAILYEWQDVFTGLSDPNFPPQTSWTLDPIASGEYIYMSDLSGQMIYIPFDVPTTLVDDQRYLFCLQSFTDSVFIGFDTKYDYDKVLENTDQPVSVIENAGSWFNVGFGTDATCAVSPMFQNANVSVNDLDR